MNTISDYCIICFPFVVRSASVKNSMKCFKRYSVAEQVELTHLTT